MAKSRPHLPAIILERLPEQHGIYRELLEQMLLLTVSDRRRIYSYGKYLWRFRAACVSNRDSALWDWLEETGFNCGDVLEDWSIEKIHEAICIYERLKDFEHDIDRIPMSVQYFIARHAFDQNWIPLIRQLLDDGQNLTIENFRNGVDPRIGMAKTAPARGGSSKSARTSIPLPSEGIDDDDEPMPWEGNGHARKPELLDAEPPSRGDENSVETFPAQKPNFGNPFSGNGNGSHKRPIERSVIRAQVAHEAAEHIHDATKTIRRACQNYGFKGRGQWEEAWFVRFRSGCEEALQALKEWETVALEESR